MDTRLLLYQTGSLLRVRREELRLTLAEVSQRSGVTIAQLSRIENGLVDARLSTLVRILDATGAGLDDIVVEPLREISLSDALRRRDSGRSRIERSGVAESDVSARLERKDRRGSDTTAERSRMDTT
ncbi:MAG: helix-turn-helix transcriptional regulator [Actinomycetia bacterium]|nr:helix-turn-helix transcriptional regulator [Actinomycetes bacterium]